MTGPFVVVGASLAGLRAVEATMIGAEPHLPYDRPPLSKEFLDATDGSGQLTAPTFRDAAHYADGLNVTLRLGQPATGLDTAAREVIVGDNRVPYSALVIATGASPRPLPGADQMSGVHTLRTLDDARAIRGALDRGARTIVIGAGFIGSEIASAARKRGNEVTVVEALPTPLARAVGVPMGRAIAELHRGSGTPLICGTAVLEVLGTGHVSGVRLADGRTLPADLVVVGIGAIPATSWLAGSGLPVDDGIVCDATLNAGVPGVYAAGDVARWPNGLFGGRLQRLEHWTSAAEQGATAARNALTPADATPYTTVPYFWSDWYENRIQFAGIPDADEVEVVDGDPGTSHRWVALYRGGDRITGALAVNGQSVIMKYRALISRCATWDDAMALAAARRQSPLSARAVP